MTAQSDDWPVAGGVIRVRFGRSLSGNRWGATYYADDGLICAIAYAHDRSTVEDAALAWVEWRKRRQLDQTEEAMPRLRPIDGGKK